MTTQGFVVSGQSKVVDVTSCTEGEMLVLSIRTSLDIRAIARYAVYRVDAWLSRVDGQVAPRVGKLLITGYRPWLNLPGAWNLWG